MVGTIGHSLLPSTIQQNNNCQEMRSRNTLEINKKLQYDPYFNPNSKKQIEPNSKRKLDT